MSCGNCSSCNAGLRSITDFAQHVIPNAAGSALQVIEAKVQETVRDFAKYTGGVERIISFETQNCVDEYFLKEPCDEIIHAVNKVTDNDCYCPAPMRERPCGTVCGSFYYFKPPCTLYLSPLPDCDGTKIYVEVTTMPHPDACAVDEIFWTRHREAIVDGTIYRMALMQQSDWYNPNVAAEKRRAYEQARRCASADEKRQYSGAPMRMRARSWL